MFAEFRRREDYTGLIDHLITTYPKNVKNRTFNFTNTGHTFHMLYAFVPSPSNKERKQIRLDCIEKLMKSTSNDFKLYEDLMKLMGDKLCENTCPCQLIINRLQENIAYNEGLLKKNFDSKPVKLKKEPIDAILFKYSINWKQSLKKKKTSVNKKSEPRVKSAHEEEKLFDYAAFAEGLSPSSLRCLNGATVVACRHVFGVQERQLRAGDEVVSFIKACTVCGLVVKE